MINRPYDPKCEELARAFLTDLEKNEDRQEHLHWLAQAIQDAIESYMEDIPHTHTCQQCDKVVIDDCACAKGNTTNVWCSSRCRAAYDL
jgi:hypothetical protein